MKKKFVKSQAVEREEAPAIVFLPAGDAEKGRQYVNPDTNCIMEFTGQRKQVAADGRFRGVTQGRELTQVEFTVRNIQGDCYPVFVSADWPLRDWPERAAELEKEHLRKAAIYKERDYGVTAPTMRTVTGDDGVEREEPIAPRRASVPRAGRNARTGCTPGSNAHDIGLIMLDAKAGANHRKVCVPLIYNFLVASGKDASAKTKALASSWYATHYTKKPEIYGKLQEGK